MTIEEVKELISQRFATHIDSRCATEEEVWLAWLICEHDRLTAELARKDKELELLEANTVIKLVKSAHDPK